MPDALVSRPRTERSAPVLLPVEPCGDDRIDIPVAAASSMLNLAYNREMLASHASLVKFDATYEKWTVTYQPLAQTIDSAAQEVKTSLATLIESASNMTKIREEWNRMCVVTEKVNRSFFGIEVLERIDVKVPAWSAERSLSDAINDLRSHLHSSLHNLNEARKELQRLNTAVVGEVIDGFSSRNTLSNPLTDLPAITSPASSTARLEDGAK